MIGENLARVRETIGKACLISGRDAQSVKVMAVTKKLPLKTIKESLAERLDYFGENQVQEARMKVKEGAFGEKTLALIGHLQTNKVSLAVRTFDEVHSVDSVRIAQAISKFSQRYKTLPMPILVQVNSGYDPKKSGVMPEDVEDAVSEILKLPGLSMKGFMAIAPLGGMEAARNAFRRLRQIKENLLDKGFPVAHLKELSMGMSGDFSIAVQEGATIVRLGSILFGPRK